jgi:hypothetical protein
MVNEADLHDNSTFGTFSALHFTAFKIKHKNMVLILLYSLFTSVSIWQCRSVHVLYGGIASKIGIAA